MSHFHLTKHLNKSSFDSVKSGLDKPHVALFIEKNKKYIVYMKTNTSYIHESGKAGEADFGPDLNGQSYVDLGLPSGLLWATYNVGATEENLYGDLFAWGETEPKEDYSWSNYKYGNGSEEEPLVTKYNINSEYGTVDNKTTLDLSDDAAHVNMGGDWRMPTKSECEELRSNTTYSWGSRGGINGMILSSKNNSNSLFFPAAGNCYGEYSNEYRGINTYIWCSNLYSDYPSYSWYMTGGEEDHMMFLNNLDRSWGHSVRGVFKNN